jgi:hypothetical protein
MDLVSTANGNVAQLLDVHVDQVAGCGVFVAANDSAGGAIQVGQAGQAVTAQHAMHGGGRHTQ